MSPLRYYTIMQTKKLVDIFENKNLIIDFAMRYGRPSIKEKMNKLHSAGVKHNCPTFVSAVCCSNNSYCV